MVMSTFLYGIQPEDNFYTFPSSLLQFCVESFNTCFSSGANGYCVPVGLTALSALLLLLSCVRSVCQRSQRPGHAFTSTYCFLGELCGAVGAVLSKQLQIQVFMGIFSLLVSAANMIFGCFPVFLCWNTLAERKRRMKRRRRRQLLLATCVFTVVSGGYLMSGFTSQRAETHFRGRGLLYIDLQFVLIFWCKQGTLQEPMRDGDTISLLGTSVVITKRKFATKMKMTPLSNLPVNTKSTEMGGYLDVDSKSALQKEAHHHPPVRTVRSINLDGLCASDTSWESSDDSSDLQWDFEQINTTWNNKKREQGREPSKECTDDLKPSSSCQYEVPLNPQMVV
ncbi:transmembrane protein 44 isoform X5 [Synchiropus splendidus]|uniref:transmembrane protein 44 isoform X5 n=1 Tax=Synchiropus splendidus TaxID=270530 RepID=UPI00237D6B93|nr:transmembrane protein 44 isoform X5 [Synchiropus splendidus]